MIRSIRLQATGGLGNQLFIWNLAHILEHRYQTSVIIDFEEASNFEFPRPNLLVPLEEFCQHDILVQKSRIIEFMWIFVDKLRIIFPKLYDNLKQIVRIVEDTEDMKTWKKKPRFVRGYFQDWQLVDQGFNYFSSELHSLFETIAIDSQIPSRYGVIHIRRGDFKKSKDVPGLLKYEYYTSQLRTNLEYIVCTDDESELDSIKSHFSPVRIYYPNTLSEWQTIKLIANSEEVITANSTFSWWGAVIAQKFNDANVILPKPWTKNIVLECKLVGNPQHKCSKAIFE